MDIENAHFLVQASEASDGKATKDILKALWATAYMAQVGRITPRVMAWIKDNPGRPASQEHIAAEVISSRETVSRSIKKLQSDGFVRIEEVDGRQPKRAYYPT